MQEVIKNFNKQNQTKADQAADTDCYKRLVFVLTVLEAYSKN